MQQQGCSCMAFFQLLDTQVMQQQQRDCGFCAQIEFKLMMQQQGRSKIYVVTNLVLTTTRSEVRFLRQLGRRNFRK